MIKRLLYLIFVLQICVSVESLEEQKYFWGSDWYHWIDYLAKIKENWHYFRVNLGLFQLFK